MTISINNKIHDINTHKTDIQSVLYQLNIDAEKGVAIAVNENIISKKDWSTHSLNENDKLLLITATQGG